MEEWKVLRVFIGSPNDVQKEREIFREVVVEVNEIKAHSHGYHLEALGWEDTLPGKGSPQDLINEDIKKADLVILVSWERWGSPTLKYSSGFEEEYELADSLNEKNNGVPSIALFFRAVPEDRMADPGEQLKSVIKFRKKIEEEKRFLFKLYEDEVQWKKLLRGYLCIRLDDFEIGVKAYKPEKKIMETESIRLPLEMVRNLTQELAKQAVEKAEEGKLTEAESLFAKATVVSGDPVAENLFGIFLHRLGQTKRAENKFKAVVSLGEETDDKEIVAAGYGNLGNVYQTRGDPDKAEEMYRASLEINDEIGHKEGMASDYGNLGNVYQTRGDPDKAEEMYRKSLEIELELDHKEGMAADYCNLGNVYLTRGDPDKAEEMYRDALKIHEEIGHKEGMASDYGNLGTVYQISGDLDKAEEMYRDALEINEEIGHKKGMASDYGNLGIVYKTSGDLDKAEEMYRDALEIHEEIGHKEGMASDYCNLGNVYLKRGDPDKAEEMYRDALEINDEIGHKKGMASDYCNLGIVYKIRGDLDKAEEMYRKSLRVFQKFGNKVMVDKIVELLKEVEKLRGGEHGSR